jgi:hypothetical protein
MIGGKAFPSPKATRTVAGGPSEASDHRTSSRAFHRLRQGSRRRVTPVGICYATPPESIFLTNSLSGGRSLRSDHRLPYEAPPVPCGTDTLVCAGGRWRTSTLTAPNAVARGGALDNLAPRSARGTRSRMQSVAAEAATTKMLAPRETLWLPPPRPPMRARAHNPAPSAGLDWRARLRARSKPCTSFTAPPAQDGMPC